MAVVYRQQRQPSATATTAAAAAVAAARIITYRDVESFARAMSTARSYKDNGQNVHGCGQPIRLLIGKLKTLSLLPRCEILSQLTEIMQEHKDQIQGLEFRSTVPVDRDIQDMALVIAGSNGYWPKLEELSILGKNVAQVAEIVEAFGKQQQQQQGQGQATLDRLFIQTATSTNQREIAPNMADMRRLFDHIPLFPALSKLSLKLDAAGCQLFTMSVIQDRLDKVAANLDTLHLQLDYGNNSLSSTLDSELVSSALAVLSKLLISLAHAQQTSAATATPMRKTGPRLELELFNCPTFFSSAAMRPQQQQTMIQLQLRDFMRALQVYPPAVLKLHNVRLNTTSSILLAQAARHMTGTQLTLCGQSGFLLGNKTVRQAFLTHLPHMTLQCLRIHDLTREQSDDDEEEEAEDGANVNLAARRRRHFGRTTPPPPPSIEEQELLVRALFSNTHLLDWHFYASGNFAYRYFCGSRRTFGQETREILQRNRYLEWMERATATLFPTNNDDKEHTKRIATLVGLWPRALAQVAKSSLGATPIYVAVQSLNMAGWKISS